MVTPAVVAFAVMSPILSTVALGLRFYVRRDPNRGLEADDWTALAIAIGLVFLSICFAICLNLIALEAIISAVSANEITIRSCASPSLRSPSGWQTVQVWGK